MNNNNKEGEEKKERNAGKLNYISSHSPFNNIKHSKTLQRRRGEKLLATE